MNQSGKKDTVGLSDYEKIRLANIKRNNDRLISLGLMSLTIVGQVTSGCTVNRKRKKLTRYSNRVKLGRLAKETPKLLHITQDTVKATMGESKTNIVVTRKSAAKPVEKIDMHTGVVLQQYVSGCAAAEDVKGHQSAISNVCNHKIKTHKGYCWQFSPGSRGNNRNVIQIGKTRVRKKFINDELGELDWFCGIVSCKLGKYYSIAYDDGDSEDMTWKDVLTCMK